MSKFELSSEEKEEIKNVICWAISEGYNTNEVTKSLIYKMEVEKNVIDNLEFNSNIGLSLR